MVLGLAAATSALDLIKTLTKAGASSKPGAGTAFSAAGAASPSASTGSAPRSGQSALISPDTMNALLAAQGQSDAASSPATNRTAALTDLFRQLDADGSGKVSKSEFETALGAGGTNIANADSVFGKLDSDGDGALSLGELSSALRGKHRAHGAKQGGAGEEALLKALDAANATGTTNSDGSVTTALTYADGSTVSMTQPAASSANSAAARSYNAIEQMIQRQAALLTKAPSPSLSLSA